MKQMLTLMAAVLTASLLCHTAAGQAARFGTWETAADSTLRGDVRTARLFSSGAEMDFPVLAVGQPAALVLELDVLRPEAEELQWHIVHCDRHWQPDELEPNEFLTGLAEGRLDEYDFSFNTRVDYVHYRTTLPGDFATFTHSGNYAVVVTAEGTGDGGREVLLWRRFCVTEQAAAVQAEVAMPYDGADRDRRQEVDVTVSSRQVALNEQWTSVAVQQNGRVDNMRQLRFSGHSGQGLTFRYRSENIFWGGNTFRFFDCSNLGASMYNVARTEEYGGQVMVMLQPDEDRSRKVYLGESTLNGGMKVNVWDRQSPTLEAEYVWVNFCLPTGRPLLEGEVHLMGALTDWHTDTLSRMDYDPRARAYTKRVLLKQGYYSYQLLVDGPTTQPPLSKTARLEGDHRETPNTYTVYVYHRSPADRADRLLAVQRVRP